MGITSFSAELIAKYKNGAKNVIELGAQNLYNQPNLPAPYAHELYDSHGVAYKCIDLCEENGAIPIDLSKPYENKLGYFDLVTDFGTSEHVSDNGKHGIEAFYNCWKTKHDLLIPGGTMINENPKTGNWPGHGCNYYTKEFYGELCNAMNYEVLELGEHPAMGNTTDGWNVFCVFKKNDVAEFIGIEKFKKLDFRTS